MSVAVIGGTGLDRMPGLTVDRRLDIATPYGTPSAPLLEGRFAGSRVLFLARHGEQHAIPPHAVNYRANLSALRQAGARSVVAVCAVGGIAPWIGPAQLAVPADLIDYTWGRAHTCSDSAEVPLRHVEFTVPFAERVRRELLHAALAARVDIYDGGVIGVTQGPRLESAAEVRRLKRDGCDMIGMTAMPEAALACELGLEYAILAVSVNWAAGLGSAGIHAEIETAVGEGIVRARMVLARALPALRAQEGP
ncbi:MAG: S-methyl-5'-thioinosine phosphorylase [Gammaproteobacteria bacterium]|nr:S-methyl-5'-thioinosine phosphorylase [Gammaproteobacteria bacterium]